MLKELRKSLPAGAGAAECFRAARELKLAPPPAIYAEQLGALAVERFRAGRQLSGEGLGFAALDITKKYPDSVGIAVHLRNALRVATMLSADGEKDLAATLVLTAAAKSPHATPEMLIPALQFAGEIFCSKEDFRRAADLFIRAAELKRGIVADCKIEVPAKDMLELARLRERAGDALYGAGALSSALTQIEKAEEAFDGLERKDAALAVRLPMKRGAFLMLSSPEGQREAAEAVAQGTKAIVSRSSVELGLADARIVFFGLVMRTVFAWTDKNYNGAELASRVVRLMVGEDNREWRKELLQLLPSFLRFINQYYKEYRPDLAAEAAVGAKRIFGDLRKEAGAAV